MNAACGMCEAPGQLEARNFGLDLCGPCAAGHLRGRLGAWGAEVDIDEVSLSDVSEKLMGSLLRGGMRPDALEADSALEVQVRSTGSQPLIATFAKATTMAKLKRMFGRGQKTGDTLFDATISVQSRTPALLKQLLANDGFQSAVMTLATHCGEVSVEPGLLHVVAPLTELDLRAEIPIAACAVMRHVASAS